MTTPGLVARTTTNAPTNPGTPLSTSTSTREVTSMLSACAEGCYKHRINGTWVCCKCGE
jgi:hypothetical protein